MLMSDDILLPIVKAIEEERSFPTKVKEALNFLVVAHLSNMESQTASDLVEHTTISRMHIYNTLNILEKRNFITRRKVGQCQYIDVNMQQVEELLHNNQKRSTLTKESLDRIRKLSKTIS